MAIDVVILTCSSCGAEVALVRDLRFGLPPPESLCLVCSHPSFHR